MLALILLFAANLSQFREINSQLKHSNKMEDKEIIETVIAIFNGTDERNWQKVENSFAATVLLDYTSMTGGKPNKISPKDIVTAWESLLTGFDSTRHEISNVKVEASGDAAIVACDGKGSHYLVVNGAREEWLVAGNYLFNVQKEKDHWKVRSMKFNKESITGNLELPNLAKNKVNNKSSSSPRKIEFNSDGLILVGNLNIPGNFDPAKKYPTIIVDGSWTTVKEQMQGEYGQKLAKEGFITLVFDHRYYGESEGQPRFWENPNTKIADIKNAITYLETVPGVDANNIFLTGICASSGYMAHVAASDDRVKGLVTIAAWLHDSESVKSVYGGEEGVQAKIKQAQTAKKKFAESGITDYILTISKTDKTAAMFDFDYYLNPDRGAVPQWSADKFAVMSWEDWLTFNPIPVAKSIKVPTLMIHSDSAVFPDNVKRFFNDIPIKDKVLHWTVGTQFDFYDQPKQVSEAVTAITAFINKHIH